MLHQTSLRSFFCLRMHLSVCLVVCQFTCMPLSLSLSLSLSLTYTHIHTYTRTHTLLYLSLKEERVSHSHKL